MSTFSIVEFNENLFFELSSEENGNYSAITPLWFFVNNPDTTSRRYFIENQ